MLFFDLVDMGDDLVCNKLLGGLGYLFLLVRELLRDKHVRTTDLFDQVFAAF